MQEKQHIAANPEDTLAIQQTLKTYFGFEACRGLQAPIIHHLLQGSDALALMPTGAGKSLCYQVPALIREGVGIVVSPLIALMQDQVDALTKQGIRAAYYNSTLDADRARFILNALHRDQLDLLYIAPERLTEHFLQRLSSCKLALFAIDEAHCISQWGHDFRPEYATLGKLKTTFPHVPIIALTASATKPTREDIILKLNYTPHTFLASFNRQNIFYRVLNKHEPLKQVHHLLKKYANQAGIIYCATRRQVDKLTQALQKAGIFAKGYHAGLTALERQTAQRLFHADEIHVVIATIAFGMGIDKPNVRFVIHYDMPKTLEHYYQETGRAGRDGAQADAILLYDPADSTRLQSLISGTTVAEKRALETQQLAQMIAFAEAVQCRRHVLLRYLDEDSEVACGHCDICHNPPLMYDATEPAQQFLSCIYRLKQNYGLTHVIDVLRGSQAEKVKRVKHHLLSTYGIGRHRSHAYWRQLGWHLIQRGFCYQDPNHYNVLKLSQRAMDILSARELLMLPAHKD